MREIQVFGRIVKVSASGWPWLDVATMLSGLK